MSWTPSGRGHKPHLGIQKGACLDEARPRATPSSRSCSPLQKWLSQNTDDMLHGALFDSEGPSRCAIKSHNIFVFKHFSVSELLSVGVLIPQCLVASAGG